MLALSFATTKSSLSLSLSLLFLLEDFQKISSRFSAPLFPSDSIPWTANFLRTWNPGGSSAPLHFEFVVFRCPQEEQFSFFCWEKSEEFYSLLFLSFFFLSFFGGNFFFYDCEMQKCFLFVSLCVWLICVLFWEEHSEKFFLMKSSCFFLQEFLYSTIARLRWTILVFRCFPPKKMFLLPFFLFQVCLFFLT